MVRPLSLPLAGRDADRQGRGSFRRWVSISVAASESTPTPAPSPQGEGEPRLLPGPALRASGAALLLALILDRAHKYLQLDLLGWHGGERVTVTPFFDYILVWNTGISYGLLASLPLVAVAAVISIALVLLIIWWLRSTSALVRIGLALALGGGLSNMFDRLLYGAVADFFYLHVGETGFYVFNVADIAISAGLCLLVLDLVWPHSTEKP